MSGRSVLCTVLLAFTCAGCQAEPLNATPIPTVTLVNIDITPAMEPYAVEINECVQKIPGLGISLTETPRSAFSLDGAQLAIQYGDANPNGGYLSDLGGEAVAVITHPDNPVSQLSLDELTTLYSGAAADWSAVADNSGLTGVLAVQTWSYSEGDDLRETFDGILGLPSQPDSSVYSVPDPGGMLEAVAQNPGAIGFIPVSWLEDSVKQITLTDGTGALLQAPRTALTSKEPAGITRELIACLQNQ